jgi:transcriptional regulator with XRE-family HTH domain
MILADKIIKLRKGLSWSQEDMAEKMNVSRQSVSKWESAKSIPDMNRILLMSRVFDVPVDYLMKDEIETIDESIDSGNEALIKVSIDDANQYIELNSKKTKLKAVGILVIIFSALPLLILTGVTALESIEFAYSNTELIGYTSMLFLITFGVILLIRASHIDDDSFMIEDNDFELNYGVGGVVKEQIKSYKSKYLSDLTIGVALFILSSFPLVLSMVLKQSSSIIIFAFALMIFLNGLGVYLVTICSSKMRVLSYLVKNEVNDSKVEVEDRTKRLAAFYWPLVATIYVAWSLFSREWTITWITWPIGSLGFITLIGLVNLLDTRNK